MLKKIALTAVVGLFLSGAANAQDAPKVAFDATYATSGPGGATTMRMMSDGKGHMRTETNAGGQKIVSIMDYPAKTAITLLEAQKMAMKMKLQSAPSVHDEESAKKLNAKSLGTKVINGHKCHGWEYTIPGGTSQVWTGDEIKYLVKSETKTKQGNMVMELKEFKTKAPGPEAFAIPTGYKVMNTPTM